jgi:hypothetical protein
MSAFNLFTLESAPVNWSDLSTHKTLTCVDHTDARFTSKNPLTRSLFVIESADCDCDLNTETEKLRVVIEDSVSRETCKHLNVKEIGMVGYFKDSQDCGYGCKIVKCEKCDETFESHRSIYGCKIG